MKQLLTIVVPRIAWVWDQVAYCMEFSIYRIRIIRKLFRDDTEECCYHLLQEWIGTDQGVTPKNWYTLLSVLKNVEALTETSICHEIEEDLKQ